MSASFEYHVQINNTAEFGGSWWETRGPRFITQDDARYYMLGRALSHDASYQWRILKVPTSVPEPEVVETYTVMGSQ